MSSVSSIRPAANPMRAVARDPRHPPVGGGLVSMLGTAERGGEWTVPSHMRVVAFCGSVRLDLRQARFESATTTIEAAVIGGRLEIAVPPGAAVAYTGDSLGARFEYHRSQSAPSVDVGPDGTPTRVLRITGSHVAGFVDVYDDPPWDPGQHVLRRAATVFGEQR